MSAPKPNSFEIFASCAPGLENWLYQEVVEAGFSAVKSEIGGVSFQGKWNDVWKANMTLRGAGKILVRIGEFRAVHLAKLDKHARKFPWDQFLRPEFSVKVETKTSKKNRIYHGGAASQRIENAIRDIIGAPIAKGLDDAQVVIKARIEDNMVKMSIDSSGEGLHKRGHKQAMGKAPMRETMAALALRACGYDGSEPVLDPMCGSGTFIIEAAEIARGLMAGRTRAISKDGYAFERLATYDPQRISALRQSWAKPKTLPNDLRFYGSDRNVNVIVSANANAKRAGVADYCEFAPRPISALTRPNGPEGLVMVNPPYGARVGKKKDLFALYNAFGQVMRDQFTGWRVGMITSDKLLADSCGLDWSSVSEPIAHGGLRVRLYQTGVL